MNVRTFLTTTALVAGLVTTGHAAAGVEVGDSPDFEFTTIEGTEVNQDNLGDNVVIIDFWATW